MSSHYLHPGVYIPAPNPPAVIRQTESAVVAFAGLTEMARGPGKKNLHLQPVIVRSLEEYKQLFGTAPATPVQLKIDEGSQGIRVDFYKPPLTVPQQLLYYAVAHFFANGGSACYIISAGNYRSPITTQQLQQALKQLSPEHSATILLCPDICNAEHQQQIPLTQMLLRHCADNQHRFCILEVPDAYPGKRDTVSAIDGYIGAFPSYASEFMPFGALYYPYIHTDIPMITDQTQIIIARHTLGAVKTRSGNIEPGTSIADKQLAVKYPHILSAAEHFIRQQCLATLPPSGAMAAIYQRTDSDRGVWKAPANVELAATRTPAIAIDNQMNQQLNTGLVRSIAVNPIRRFPRLGIRVWGARTLAGYDPEWRYISVRRLAGMIHHSVSREFAQWPKDANSQQGWSKARSMVENFLMQLWQQGALSGARPDHAFFTAIGPRQSMTQDDIDNDRLVIHLGFAPLSPAEFIVLVLTFQLK